MSKMNYMYLLILVERVIRVRKFNASGGLLKLYEFPINTPIKEFMTYRIVQPTFTSKIARHGKYYFKFYYNMFDVLS